MSITKSFLMKRKITRKVLVLDGMWNKSLAAVRSFGERGFSVTVGESTRLCTSMFSRYATRRVVYPSVSTRPVEFLEWLRGELEEWDYDLVLPTEYATQLLISEEASFISRGVGFPFPEPGLMKRVHDKGWLMQYALDKGLPVPKTWLVEGGVEAIASLIEEVSFPAVIKPTKSSGSRGIVYINNKDEFIQACHKVHEKYPCPIVQEYIPPCTEGTGGFGVGVLFNFRHEPRAAFVYKRLREYPVSGGPSTFRESVEYDELKEMAINLLTELKWVGPAMVEFKIDPRDGKPLLLEINPRLWGSLRLATLAGVDFPYLIWKLATEGDVEPVMRYRTGVKCRWLLPGDIMYVLTNKRKLRALKDIFKRSDGDDILSLKDPLPVFGRLCSVLTFISNPDMRKLLYR